MSSCCGAAGGAGGCDLEGRGGGTAGGVSGSTGDCGCDLVGRGGGSVGGDVGLACSGSSYSSSSSIGLTGSAKIRIKRFRKFYIRRGEQS